MLENIKHDVIVFLYRVSIRTEEDIKLVEEKENKQKMNYRHPSSTSINNRQNEASSEQPFVRNKPKIGRNEPCPCGSGKKYKQCHGRLS
jgi:preprotein translocase subunit SecA